MGRRGIGDQEGSNEVGDFDHFKRNHTSFDSCDANVVVLIMYFVNPHKLSNNLCGLGKGHSAQSVRNRKFHLQCPIKKRVHIMPRYFSVQGQFP